MTTRTNDSSSSTYSYAGGDQNELVSTATGTNTTSYVYGQNDRDGVPMLQAFTKNGQTSYIDYDPTGSPIALQGSGGATDYYALDNQGTPVNLVNNTGAATATYSYDPSGKQLSATGTAAAANPLRYAQGLLDEQAGWLKHGVRWHDTTTASWTAQDPISQLMQPDAASRYAYASGNPLNNLDPTGLFEFWNCVKGGLSITAGFTLIGASLAGSFTGVALLGVVGGYATTTYGIIEAGQSCF